jgi:integrase
MAAYIPGLFMRGSSYYLRICLPQDHPLRVEQRNGHLVRTLGQCSYLEAVRQATLRRAEVLCGYQPPPSAQAANERPTPSLPAAQPLHLSANRRLRCVFVRWVKASQRSPDSQAACERAVCLFEKLTGDPPISDISRALGDDFKSQLQTLPTSSKTARDRFNWVKGLLKYAAQDLEWLAKSPWTGLEIKTRISSPRSPWSEAYVARLLGNDIWTRCALPSDRKAGGWAAYWIPLLAMFTGARCSELCQLMVNDIDSTSPVPTLRITDEGVNQHVKTSASIRLVPIHSELERLEFLDYVQTIGIGSLWPELPLRKNKPGGYFSQWFGSLRREIGIAKGTDFHSFRHTARSKLAAALVPEPIIDRVIGHEVGGSVGAKVYTHVSTEQLRQAIQTIGYAAASELIKLERREGITPQSPAPPRVPSHSKRLNPGP